MSQGKRQVSAFLLLAALASASPMSALADNANGIDTTTRIIGGRDADANNWSSLGACPLSDPALLVQRLLHQ